MSPVYSCDSMRECSEGASGAVGRQGPWVIAAIEQSVTLIPPENLRWAVVTDVEVSGFCHQDVIPADASRTARVGLDRALNPEALTHATQANRPPAHGHRRQVHGGAPRTVAHADECTDISHGDWWVRGRPANTTRTTKPTETRTLYATAPGMIIFYYPTPRISP